MIQQNNTLNYWNNYFPLKNTLISHFNNCIFCDFENFNILEETNHLYLLEDNFPIVNKHLMIVSKSHVGCLGEYPVEWFDEIDLLQVKVNRIYKGSPFITYEHGRAGHCTKLLNSEIQCEHQHLHFLPLDIDISKDLDKSFKKINLNSFRDVKEAYNRHGEYLLFGNKNQIELWYDLTDIPSHYLRTLICKYSNNESKADWEFMEKSEADDDLS